MYSYYNVGTYARNGMDARHARVGDLVGPMATRLRAIADSNTK